jgi:putative transposase
MRPTREQARRSVGVYFVSTQTAGRKPFFRHERWAKLIVATLDHYAAKDFRVYAFVVMPDHLHLLIEPFSTIEKAVQLIKGGFSFRAKREFDWKGDIWQPGFTEHRIRDDQDWQHHLEYIRMNPLRARLVDESALYPYMNFFTEDFPQGLKPPSCVAADVRAEARTLPPDGTAEAVPFQNLVEGTASALEEGGSYCLKGHDFSRAENTSLPRAGALAPERKRR